jgi:TRAP-type C4-dicarboxylate transport system permease small subunit
MSAGRAVLSVMSAFERAACVFGFVVMGGALIVDVGARLWSRAIADAAARGWLDAVSASELSLGGGVLGAPQIGVIGMIIVAMFGLGVAVQKGAQLRARVLDGLVPKAWSGAIDRIADVLTAVMMGVIAALCLIMTQESAVMGDVTSVLRWPIWPFQAVIVAAFAMNALRYAIFALDPGLRPREDLEPETPGLEEQPR